MLIISHNNIDIEIEDISFWMNKFYPMKIKTILNLRRIIKVLIAIYLLDC